MIFGLGAGPRHKILTLATPRNEIGIQKNAEAYGGAGVSGSSAHPASE